ncbi:unnamed protein product, partial [Anisakis simplex]|uniref:FH2 domain-containing protein n=1 Tax=Anisakis simplex TaxID=6269 RepID=A0A0M3K211_ANISI
SKRKQKTKNSHNSTVSTQNLDSSTDAEIANSQSKTSSPSCIAKVSLATKTVRTLLAELKMENVNDGIKAENMRCLNSFLLQCKGFLNRCYLRQNLMSLGLFDALPRLVESNNSLLTAQLDVFFSSESNDNLVTGPSGKDQRHPIELFHRAYLHVKRTAHCASLFLDLLEKIASVKPNPKRMMRAIQILTQGHMRTVATQTDEVEMYGDARSMLNDHHEIAKVCQSSQTSDDAKMRNHLSNDSSTLIQEDALKLNGSPPPAKVDHFRPNHSSPSYFNYLPENFSSLPSVARLTSTDQPSAAASATASTSIPTMPPASPPHSPLSPALSPTPALPPPPPPPPPPSPAFLNSSLLSKNDNSLNSPTIFKSASVYKKKRSTNTINWEAVKPEILLAKTTVWNEKRVDDLDFNQYQRDFLERVFERAPSKGFPLRGQSLDESKKDHILLHHLTEKRALNLGIVLARFSRFRPDTANELINKLESHETAVELNVDYLTSLIKHFPTSDEVGFTVLFVLHQLDLSYFKKLPSSEDLRDAELFCYLAAQHPNLKLCVELRILAETVATDLSRQTQCARSILIASQELENHKGVILFLHRCLQFGNFLNQSTFAAGASGFALSSLLSTLNAKGRGQYERTRLIDIVAESADENLRSVIPLIARIRPTRGCSVQELERWEKTFRASIENTRKRVNECGDEELFRRYSPLLMNKRDYKISFQDSITKCDHLAKILREARSCEKKLCVFYCAETFSIEAILDVFWNAFTLFENAIKVSSAEEREIRFNRQRSLRAKAAPDIHVLHASQRFERRRHTLGPPTVKDLISIINSTHLS